MKRPFSSVVFGACAVFIVLAVYRADDLRNYAVMLIVLGWIGGFTFARLGEGEVPR